MSQYLQAVLADGPSFLLTNVSVPLGSTCLQCLFVQWIPYRQFLQLFPQSSEGIQLSHIFPNHTNRETKLSQVFLLPKAVVIMEFTNWFFAFSLFAIIPATWSFMSKLCTLSMKCISGRLVTGTLYITCGECAELSTYTNQTHTHSDWPQHTVSRWTRFYSDQDIICTYPISGKWWELNKIVNNDTHTHNLSCWIKYQDGTHTTQTNTWSGHTVLHTYWDVYT